MTAKKEIRDSNIPGDSFRILIIDAIIGGVKIPHNGLKPYTKWVKDHHEWKRKELEKINLDGLVSFYRAHREDPEEKAEEKKKELDNASKNKLFSNAGIIIP